MTSDQPQLVQPLDGEPKPLRGERLPSVNWRCRSSRPAWMKASSSAPISRVSVASRPRAVPRPPRADRDNPKTGRLQPIGGAGGERALTRPADPGDHGEGRVAVTEGRNQPLSFAAAADETLAQPLDPVAQEGVFGARAGVWFRGALGSKTAPAAAEAIDLQQGEGRVLNLAGPPFAADQLAGVGRGGGYGLAADQAAVELLGEVGRPVVGDAGRPADRQRYTGHRPATGKGRPRPPATSGSR